MSGVSGISSLPIQAVNNDNSSASIIAKKAKARGAPDHVIAQGPAAIKSWAQENGKIPASASKESAGTAKQDIGDQNVNRSTNPDKLTKQVEPARTSYDRFGQALERASESTKELLDGQRLELHIQV